MTQPPLKLWLARAGQVHGPYGLPQLQEMDARVELLPTDSFCPEGEESWMSYSAWRESILGKATTKPKQTIIGRKASAADTDRKTKKVNLSKPPLLASLPPKKSTTPAPAPKFSETAPAPEAKADSHVHADPQRRLARMAEALNDHRREYAHKHPFYFTEPQQLADVIVWLDAHHRGWDAPVMTMSEIMDRWFIPALAAVKPDTLKPSHRNDFGPGRPWPLLE